MATLIARRVHKPCDTTTRRTYTVLEVRCLLCGIKFEAADPAIYLDGAGVVTPCSCYELPLQPIIIVNEGNL